MVPRAPQLSLSSLLPTTKPLKPGQTKRGPSLTPRSIPPHNEGSQTPQAATCTRAQRRSEPPVPHKYEGSDGARPLHGKFCTQHCLGFLLQPLGSWRDG